MGIGRRNPDALKNIDPGISTAACSPSWSTIRQRFAKARVRCRAGIDGRPAIGLPENPDDFAHCRIRAPKDIRERYVPNFFFGCEAEDPLIAWAFNSRVNPLGARLNAVLGSDIGHWDVPDMEEIAAEAYELVEQGVLSEQDFRDFTFANPIKLWASLNPDFFKGTAVEKPVSEFLAG